MNLGGSHRDVWERVRVAVGPSYPDGCFARDAFAARALESGSLWAWSGPSRASSPSQKGTGSEPNPLAAVENAHVGRSKIRRGECLSPIAAAYQRGLCQERRIQRTPTDKEIPNDRPRLENL